MVTTRPAPPTSARVFISYRREDTAFAAGWLYDRLSDRFGPTEAFKDVECIRLGTNFEDVIEGALDRCIVLLALIGTDWLTVRDSKDRRRLELAEDYVRMEIAAALARHADVIPVLVGGASMPSAEDLPPDLAPLAKHHALELSSSRFESDAMILFSRLDEILDPPPKRWLKRVKRAAKKAARRHPVAMVAGAAAVAVALVGVLTIATGALDGGNGSGPATTKKPSAAVPAAAALTGDELVLPLDAGDGMRLVHLTSDGSVSADPLTETTPAHAPVLSTDRRTVFYLKGLASPAPWVMASDGGDDRELFGEALTDCPAVQHLAVSPVDADVLALVCLDEKGFSRLLMVHVDGRLIRELHIGTVHAEDPTFSPDGKRIAYWAAPKPGPHGALFTIAANSHGHPHRLTDGPGDSDPAWSKDNQIAFTRSTKLPGQPRSSAIYLVPAAGGEATSLVEGGLNVKPAWSPTADRLVFVRAEPAGSGGTLTQELLQVDADGGAPEPLGVSGVTLGTPAWGAR
jgi:hypothetical protein